MTKLFENIYISEIDNKNISINDNKDGKLTKYVIKTPIMNSPFGIEEYNNKFILNLEFTNLNKDSNINKFYNLCKTIDTYFCELKNESLKNKTFYSSLKNRPNNYDPLLRTSIKKNRNIIITNIIDQNNNPLTIYDIKPNDKIIAYIEISSIWLHNNDYGLNYQIKKIIKQ